MTAGYQVQTRNWHEAGRRHAVAKEWLPGLQAAVTRADASVISLPYADPDLVAGVRFGFATAMGVASATGLAAAQSGLRHGARSCPTAGHTTA